MTTNLLVKRFLSRLREGSYINEGSTIPLYPTMNVRRATVAAKTADYTVTITDLRKPTIFNNTGAGGTITLSLPPISTAAFKVIRAHALAAQIIRLDANGTEVVNYNGSVVAGKYVQLAGVIGNFIELFCDGRQWIVTQSNGVVTKEA